MVERVAGLGALAARFDAFLVDQFGVLVDGAGVYPFAPAALARLAALGKPVLVLSNSGRRSGPNEARLTALGFARRGYLGVLSSGEVAHAELARRIGVSIPAGTRVWVHARSRGADCIEGLALQRVPRPGRAELILLAGSRGDRMGLAAYERLLRPAATRGVPCLCSNPDTEMLTPGGVRIGAGRIAALYAAMGGPVEWIGKPHPPVYAEARRRLPGIEPSRILCIGDSPTHDVAGGRAAGHATALVRTGLHADLDEPALLRLCEAEGAVPDILLPRFAFDP